MSEEVIHGIPVGILKENKSLLTFFRLKGFWKNSVGPLWLWEVGEAHSGKWLLRNLLDFS